MKLRTITFGILFISMVAVFLTSIPAHADQPDSVAPTTLSKIIIDPTMPLGTATNPYYINAVRGQQQTLWNVEWPFGGRVFQENWILSSNVMDQLDKNGRPYVVYCLPASLECSEYVVGSYPTIRTMAIIPVSEYWNNILPTPPVQEVGR